MTLLTGALAALAVVTAVVAVGAIAYRAVIARRSRTNGIRPVGPSSSDKEIYRRHGGASKKTIDPPKAALRYYQYLAAGKIDRLYEQVVVAGSRPTTTTSQIGPSSIAQIGESAGSPAPLTTVQKLEALRSSLQFESVEAESAGRTEKGSAVLVHGSMLMKHAILPVYDTDETPTQAVWIGRLDSGRFVCLGSSAANFGVGVPRGQYLNSGVAGVLQAIRTAWDDADVRFQPDVRSLSFDSASPLHNFPGAWDAEVVDVWTHFRGLHAHRVDFIATLMTSSARDIGHPRYDILVGSPLSVEFV